MPQPLDVKRLVATGRQLTDRSRSRGRQLGTDLFEQGRLATEHIVAAVDELLNRAGRERIEELRQTIGAEVQQQLQTLSVSIKADLAKGRVVADRIETAVDELRTQRREHEDALREAVRDEVQRQLSTLGFATGEDLAALGHKIGDQVTALEDRAARRAQSSTTDNEPAHSTGPASR